MKSERRNLKRNKNENNTNNFRRKKNETKEMKIKGFENIRAFFLENIFMFTSPTLLYFHFLMNDVNERSFTPFLCGLCQRTRDLFFIINIPYLMTKLALLSLSLIHI